jgi:hypothetical protein
MNDQNEQRERLSTAYHEAGHAVVAVYYEFPLSHVEITAPDDQDKRGACHLDSLPAPGELDEDGRLAFGIRYVCQSLAGRVAEARHLGVPPVQQDAQLDLGAFQDDTNNWNTLDAIDFGSDEEAVAFLKWLNVRTWHLVEKLWPQIHAVAVALNEKGRLTGDEVTAAMRSTLGWRRGQSGVDAARSRVDAARASLAAHRRGRQAAMEWFGPAPSPELQERARAAVRAWRDAAAAGATPHAAMWSLLESIDPPGVKLDLAEPDFAEGFFSEVFSLVLSLSAPDNRDENGEQE